MHDVDVDYELVHNFFTSKLGGPAASIVDLGTSRCIVRVGFVRLIGSIDIMYI